MSVIDAVRVHEVFVSAKTTWLFLEIRASSGAFGIGEVTFFGREDGVRQNVAVVAQALTAMPVRDRARFLAERRARERDVLALLVLSGVEQALTDLRARELQVPSEELLGGRRTGAIRCYANINRGTSDRSPAGWAVRAQAALAEGYRAIKLAPFDGVLPDRLADPVTRRRIQHGIDSIAAIREAVGPDIVINVDCHMRFNEPAAKALILALAPSAPFWVETPILETPENLPAIRRVRSFANDRGIRIAGGEDSFGLREYRAIVESEAMDVVLPDIRLCGGPIEALRMAQYVATAGIEFSLHNPVGPALDAISLRTAAAAPSMIMLEQAFAESELAATTVHWRRPPFENGVRILDETPGWGLALRPEVIARHGRPEGQVFDLHGVAGAGGFA